MDEIVSKLSHTPVNARVVCILIAPLPFVEAHPWDSVAEYLGSSEDGQC